MRSPHSGSRRAVQTLFSSLGPLCSRCCLRQYSERVFREGDVVALSTKPASVVHENSAISKPLSPDGKTPVEGRRFKGRWKKAQDSVAMNDIIGKPERTVVTSMKGTQYMIHRPTLTEYITYCARVVTPIYPQDANIIVSLLDLHPSAPGTDNDEEKLEIFEAGTGHGSLTLHLARAICAANTPAPKIPPRRSEEPANECEEAYTAWRATRRAVVHSLDISPAHSSRAQAVVRDFRRGMYFPHVDFHVGQIEEYISSRLESTSNGPFLSHAVLDLPDPSLYLELFGRAINPLGKLITFNPSITQTVKCLETVAAQQLPFVLDKVLEVGTGVGSGGRVWDVRHMLPRTRQRAAMAAESEATSEEELLETLEEEVESSEEVSRSGESDFELSPNMAKDTLEIVCRPKAGVKASGGGFVGLWRRKHFRGGVPTVQ